MKKKKVIVTSRKIEDEINPKTFYKDFFRESNGEKRKNTYEVLNQYNKSNPSKNFIKQSLLDLLGYLPSISYLIADKKLVLSMKEVQNLLDVINENLIFYFDYLANRNFKRGYDFNKNYKNEVKENEK